MSFKETKYNIKCGECIAWAILSVDQKNKKPKNNF